MIPVCLYLPRELRKIKANYSYGYFRGAKLIGRERTMKCLDFSCYLDNNLTQKD